MKRCERSDSWRARLPPSKLDYARVSWKPRGLEQVGSTSMPKRPGGSSRLGKGLEHAREQHYLYRASRLEQECHPHPHPPLRLGSTAPSNLERKSKGRASTLQTFPLQASLMRSLHANFRLSNDIQRFPHDVLSISLAFRIPAFQNHQNLPISYPKSAPVFISGVS